MLESTFKSKVRKKFKKLDWDIVQFVAGAGVPEGWFDTLFVSPTGYSCYVEFKKSKDAPRRPLQEYWNKRLNDRGHDAFFVYPENEREWFDEVISKSEKLSTATR